MNDAFFFLGCIDTAKEFLKGESAAWLPQRKTAIAYMDSLSVPDFLRGLNLLIIGVANRISQEGEDPEGVWFPTTNVYLHDALIGLQMFHDCKRIEDPTLETSRWFWTHALSGDVVQFDFDGTTITATPRHTTDAPSS